jgi:hypothetical protein
MAYLAWIKGLSGIFLAKQCLSKFQGEQLFTDTRRPQEEVRPTDSAALHSPAKSLNKLVMSLDPMPHWSPYGNL